MSESFEQADRSIDGDVPEVGIVVLTWENYAETRDCLNSLSSISYPNHRVIVVDNGSQDGSLDRLQREFDWCEFVCNEENLGVTRGNNAGIEYAIDTGVEYVVLLNDDTIVTEDFLTPLVETAEEEPDTAVVGGINYYEPTGEIHNAGARFSTLLGGRTRLITKPRDVEPYSVGYVPTCLALLDVDFVRENDVLCEGYLLGMEDVDLAWQARESGWRVLVTPESAIYHRLGATSTRSPFGLYHRTRNRLLFAQRHLSIPHTVVFLFVFYLWTAMNCLQSLARRDTASMIATGKGIVDHYTDREFRSYDELNT
jgi:GT2 family glycosyltransferase